ncbi:hypothetical protein EZV62_012845 [Acer yangbiense]|uniref:Programmed cell death protein 4 n=1 Tax=Acer yangbiense TaxID=1000413 RepID=A0A5C7HZD0_9ROSI|nr:hypothetical protein EZV62_012845 [Acer yangbiense]
MKNGGKSNGGARSGAKSEARKDRKSGTGKSGSPKKGGHGGKFTWSGDGYSLAEIGSQREVVDARDPNFEDPEPKDTVTVTV